MSTSRHPRAPPGPSAAAAGARPGSSPGCTAERAGCTSATTSAPIRPLLDLAVGGTTQAVVLRRGPARHDHRRTIPAGCATHDPRARRACCSPAGSGTPTPRTVPCSRQVPAHTELAYLLECTAAYGEMTRMIQFKEKAGSGGGRRGCRCSPTRR